MVLVGRRTNATSHAGRPGNYKVKQRDSLPLQHSRHHDGNSPCAKGRTTPKGNNPPSQRLISSNRASPAKSNSSISRAPVQRPGKALRESPSLPSKCVNTSSLSIQAAIAQDGTANRSATPVRSREATTPAAKRSPSDLPKLQTDTDTIRKARSFPTPLYENAAMPSQSDKPLPKDKPLPTRPTLTFLHSPSPSKRSRSLLDATDKPMAVKVGDTEHDWPTLNPRSSSVPARELLKGHARSAQSMAHRSMSASAARESVYSSEPMSASTEYSGYVAASDRDPESPSTEYSDDHAWRQNPKRSASLLPKASSGSLAKTAAAKQSRQLTPSPSSFSRPRISSGTQGRGTYVTSTSAATTTMQAKSQRTASRIPVPDSKKATLVYVNNRPPSRAMTPVSAYTLSYGGRKLDAADTMNILDDSVRRRQLQRRGTDRTSATAASMSTREDEFLESPTLVRSNAASPDNTASASSSEEEEIVTPTFKATAFMPRPGRKIGSDAHDSARRLFEGGVDDLHRGPPPTSPFAGTLPTIPSQAVLPLEAFQELQDAPSISTLTLQQRLSKLYDEHVTGSGVDREGRSFVSEHARASLLDLINEYTGQGKHRAAASTDGGSLLDPDARAHVEEALSMLEGTDGSVNTEISNDVLLKMFGDLKHDRGNTRGQANESVTPRPAAHEDCLTAKDSHSLPPRADSASKATPPRTSKRMGSQPSRQATLPPQVGGVASKWSGSTASPIIQPLSSHPVKPASQAAAAPSADSNSCQSSCGFSDPESIGYPSKVACKVSDLIGPGAYACTAPSHDALRRKSSSMLGTPQQSSVRPAKDSFSRSRGGFAAPTASAEARKLIKAPSPRTRLISTSGLDISSKPPSAIKVRSGTDLALPPKTVQTHSKGRNMLSKLNSMFSGKRDKKSGRSGALSTLKAYEISAEEPQRAASSDIMNDWERDAVNSSRQDPFLAPSKPCLIPKMPTSSPERPRDPPTPATSPTPELSAEPTMSTGNATHDLCVSLIRKAKTEPQPARKERLLTFAKVLNDSLISTREAQISAETAQHAARSAQMAYELTVKSVAMLQRLATGLTTTAKKSGS